MTVQLSRIVEFSRISMNEAQLSQTRYMRYNIQQFMHGVIVIKTLLFYFD